jgi:hypothetical protein
MPRCIALVFCGFTTEETDIGLSALLGLTRQVFMLEE